MHTLEKHHFATREQMFAALAERVATSLRRALKARGAASLVVSGGRTPEPLFQRLASQELTWSKVTVTLADERWVPASDPASNERLVRRQLLTDRASAAAFIGLKTSHDSPEEGESACHQALTNIVRPFDVVLLGYGEDGHFASLFPGAASLSRGLEPDGDRCCLAVRAPGAGQPRMTLTLATLLDSNEIVLLSTGQAKLDTLAATLLAGPAEAMPLRALLGSGARSLAHFWAP